MPIGSSRILLGGSTQGFCYGLPRPRWPTHVESVRAVASLGLGVEVWFSRAEGDPEPEPAVLAEMRDILRKAPFVSVHSRFALWTWDPGGLRHEISLAGAVGARVLVLHRGSLGLADRTSRADFPEIQRLADEAGAAGVRLALENGRDDTWALDRVLDEVGDSPAETNLGVCLDVGHAGLSSTLGGSPVRTFLARYARQTVHLHLHDNAGLEDDHRIPGEGGLDWPDALAALDEMGFVGAATLEILSPGNLVEAFVDARAFLQRVGLRA